MKENSVALTNPITLSGQISDLVQSLQIIRDQIENSGDPGIRLVHDELIDLINTLPRIRRESLWLEEQNSKLQSLAGINQILNSTLDPNDILQIVMDTLVKLIGAERGFLMLMDDKQDLVVKIARNWDQQSIEESEVAFSRTVINQVIATSKPILTTNALQDPRFDNQQSVITHQLRSILCVPLVGKGKIIGVIYADNRVKTGLFTGSDLDLLSVFADQAAVALENAQLFDSLLQSFAEVSDLKNLLQDVFASINSGVITTDLDHTITFLNQAARLILDPVAEDCIGCQIEDISIFQKSDLIFLIQKVYAQKKGLNNLQLSLEIPSRERIALNCSISLLQNEQGEAQGTVIIFEDLTDKLRLEARNRLFERMVSPAIISELDPDELSLGGKHGEITTLFADLHGFTGWGEQINPEELITSLNQFLGEAATAILREGGTIDKFVGDAIMAFFNAPILQENHALRAVKAAWRMREAYLLQTPKQSHETIPSFGIGIHTGEAILGLIGSPERMDYTAIGDSVNTAKRVQELAAAGQILITAPVYEMVKSNISTRSLPPLVLRGKKESIQIYEVLDISL
jgi:adenylate cyclase